MVENKEFLRRLRGDGFRNLNDWLVVFNHLGKDDIPTMESKIHDPNHQPVRLFPWLSNPLSENLIVETRCGFWTCDAPRFPNRPWAQSSCPGPQDSTDAKKLVGPPGRLT